MSVAAGVSDAAITVRDKLRGKIGQTKVKRYWPGKAPEWAEEAREREEAAGEEAGGGHGGGQGELRMERIVPRDDARLKRLAESRRDREEAIARHRQIRAAEIVSTKEEAREEEGRREEEERREEDDEAIEERRRRIREKLLQRQREVEEEEGVGEEEGEEEEDEEEESEYETDEEDEEGGVAMLRPMFVPKAERDIEAERKKLEEEEQVRERMLQQKLEERKAETKQILVEEIRKEEEIEKARAEEGDGGEVDTDDEANEAEEYETWKAREIARIRRDKEDRETAVKEKEELEKLRNMTEEERREWERKNPKQMSVAPKKKWKFMQKYFHKGAFFQDQPDDTAGTAGGGEIYHRDFSAPTGEDKMDKTNLPKVMQVKHFGRSGRTKWTHLVNEDTTQWDNPWTYNDDMRAKYNAKMAGMNRPIAKPKGSKKLKDWND